MDRVLESTVFKQLDLTVSCFVVSSQTLKVAVLGSVFCTDTELFSTTPFYAYLRGEVDTYVDKFSVATFVV